MKPSASKFKRAVRGKFDNLLVNLRPPTPTISRQPSPEPSIRSPSPSSQPSDIVNTDAGCVHSPPVTAATQPNPTSSHSTAGVWGRLDMALRVLQKGTEIFPPAQSAIGAFIPCIELTLSKNRQEYEEIATEIASQSELLARHMDPSNATRLSEPVTRFARGIEEQANIIEGKRRRRIGRRLLELSADEDEIGKCYRRIGSLFRQLQIDANLGVWKTVDDQLMYTQLEGLSPAKLASYDSALSNGISRRTCTEGTRTAILSGLDSWSNDPEAADLYWMNGMAGTGKTTIACTFSQSLEACGRLAASFFCTRTILECRDVKRIIPTIAYQLAQHSISFRFALCGVISKDPGIGTKNTEKQFARLLKEPLLKVKEEIPAGLVIIIDALDECDDALEVELLLSVLLESVADIPLKFFVTSRPEPEIYKRMLARGQGYRKVMHLHEVERSLVQADIELYLRAELEFMLPAVTQVKELAQRSGRLFIYAATLVRYIRTRNAYSDPQRRLQSVLSFVSNSTKQHAEIDALYAAVLKAALDHEELEAQESENIRRVLETVVCAQEPVSIQALAELVGLDEVQTQAALQPLRAVLHFSEANGLASTFHASFPDFLFDKARSGPLCCDVLVRNDYIARCCFKIMESQLRFNICELKSSFLSDSEIRGLEDRVKEAIPSVLLYACQYWSDHLKQSTYSDSLRILLDRFLADQLLFWMEVLNLRHKIGSGAAILLKAKSWLQANTVAEDTSSLLEDARNFVQSFAINPVSESTPHIYISSLPFCSRSSSVFKQYWKKTNGLMNITGSAMQRTEASELVRWKIDSRANTVAYSPDNAHLAAGCTDGTIIIRNTQNRAPNIDLLKGHIRPVNSIVYSPNGTHVASGSADRTVMVWNINDHKGHIGPFHGHEDAVTSVAYSPGGSHIASGSSDKTIRVWDAHTGSLVAGPFRGHTDGVNSVAYSPDGTCIASGSSDSTIRLWNAHKGTLVDQLQALHSIVRSVAFLPDGNHVLFTRNFERTKIWHFRESMHTSDAIPYTGHTNAAPVDLVVYSHDGGRIALGSHNTIQVMDARDGTLVAGPFQVHASLIAIAYSPDGTRVVSTSDDGVIRLWDAQLMTTPQKPYKHLGTALSSHLELLHSLLSFAFKFAYIFIQILFSAVIISLQTICFLLLGKRRGFQPIVLPIANPYLGYTGSVKSVTFSSDGTCVISGSDDRGIKVWDARTGTPIASPFTGTAKFIRSVVCSPDGTQLAANLDKNTFQTWHAQNGIPVSVAATFEGHKAHINSLAYSLDGARIVSGSVDQTVCIWKARDGSLVAAPLKGHTGSVNSVVYSPNGNHVASGSDDGTVIVWSTHNHTRAVDPLGGHLAAVTSVAYSPDGSRIASGSSDKTIRVWDAHTGSLVAGPFNGHTGGINSVAYSPDGVCIASGSSDSTTRVWDGRDGTPVAEPFRGHSGSIASVAYSPDGTRIVSGSSDCSIRLWNATHKKVTDARHGGVTELDQPADENGWVVRSNTKLLFWVPSVLRPAYLSPSTCVLVIDGENGDLNIDYGDMLFGERWDQCYKVE